MTSFIIDHAEAVGQGIGNVLREEHDHVRKVTAYKLVKLLSTATFESGGARYQAQHAKILAGIKFYGLDFVFVEIFWNGWTTSFSGFTGHVYYCISQFAQFLHRCTVGYPVIHL